MESDQDIIRRPVMVFDGDCRFCRQWIERWREATGDRVDYIPYQDDAVARDFPQLSVEQCERAVHFIGRDGRVSSGAEAALRCLAEEGGSRAGWWLYRRVPVVGLLAERLYRFVADHRRLFSTLTRLGWGSSVHPPQYVLVRRLFVAVMGLIYLAAFASLNSQILGLAGESGIMPARQVLESRAAQADAQGLGATRYWQAPTVFWLSASDVTLQWVCRSGMILSALVVLGIAPGLCLWLLWGLYLSLLQVCPLFLGYQWDTLLLETGLLAACFATGLTWARRFGREWPPSRILVWLMRWLLFRLMFASGAVKLLSGDAAWRDWSALTVHYESQPLPTWIGWAVHQWPAGFHSASVFVMFGIELVVPFLFFAPRRIRMAAAWPVAGLMLVIAMTGNYCFFNALTVALCLTLFDDAGLRALIPRRWVARMGGFKPADRGPRLACGQELEQGGFARVARSARRAATVGLALVILVLSGVQFLAMFSFRPEWPGPVSMVYRAAAPFHSVNHYGLFAVMTTRRMEIVVEGSRDGAAWEAYEFRYKPGRLDGRPAFVAPHQPRLDWQMWFAALGTYRSNPWLVQFVFRLLQGEPEVLALLDHNPFPESPPLRIRALLFEYRFTDSSQRRESGNWWRREPKGYYLPEVSLEDFRMAP